MANDIKTGAATGARTLEWTAIDTTAAKLATAITRDHQPDVIVAIARGGLIPGVLLSHLLGVRDVRALSIVHTENDDVDAAKTTEPIVVRPDSLGELQDQDVLLVDDIAGTGDTLTHARVLLTERGATRVRTAVLQVNTANWDHRNQAPTYAGHQSTGWVIFPWE